MYIPIALPRSPEKKYIYFWNLKKKRFSDNCQFPTELVLWNKDQWIAMLGIGNIFAKSSFTFTPRIGNYSIHRSGTTISFYLQPHYLVAHNVSFPPLIRAAEARRQLQRGFVPGGIKGINMTHKVRFQTRTCKSSGYCQFGIYYYSTSYKWVCSTKISSFHIKLNNMY